MSARYCIVGCGDIGRRVAKALIARGVSPRDLLTTAKSERSLTLLRKLGLAHQQLDLDQPDVINLGCAGSHLFYTVAPPREGKQDLRSAQLIKYFIESNEHPLKVVLISTSGVYGDRQGDWVDEQCPPQATSPRAQRRLDSEQRWLAYGRQHAVPVVVVRVPGIYARSRLPVKRVAQGEPVVRADECGYSNRIHADDLAEVLIAAMRFGEGGDVFNASDGAPGKMTDYLQAVAALLGYPPLPEISMHDAQYELSEGMLSYLRESRRLKNDAMIKKLKVTLRYPDFLNGIKHG
ncbi:MAG: NAD-dependent epimerase/dehydratase family protein [Gammaproteobacteria bacterium]|nr:NAD-dependent epimerase/dehydratase family protein [Gammaproteobacteria bacterium]